MEEQLSKMQLVRRRGAIKKEKNRRPEPDDLLGLNHSDSSGGSSSSSSSHLLTDHKKKTENFHFLSCWENRREEQCFSRIKYGKIWQKRWLVGPAAASELLYHNSIRACRGGKRTKNGDIEQVTKVWESTIKTTFSRGTYSFLLHSGQHIFFKCRDLIIILLFLANYFPGK